MSPLAPPDADAPKLAPPETAPIVKSLTPDYLFLKSSNKDINQFLGGGLLFGSMCGIFGKYGSGKTQWCMDFAKNALLQKRTVVYIDSDAANGFNVLMAVNLLTAIGVKIDAFNPGNLPDREKTQKYALFVEEIARKHKLFILRPLTIDALDKTITEVTTKIKADLLIVDSLTLYYKDDVTMHLGSSQQYGGKYLPMLTKIGQTLEQYAKNVGTCIICTLQRLSEIGLEKATKLTPNEQIREWVGTEGPAYKFNDVIELKKERNTFRAYLHKKRGNVADPMKGVLFTINNGGIA